MNSQTKSNMSQHLQDCILLLCLTDSEFIKMIRAIIQPKHFSSSLTADLVQCCFNYFDKFKEAPKAHFENELNAFLFRKEDNEKEYYKKYVNRILDIDSPNKQYVLSKISEFIQAREFETAALEFIDLVKQEKFDAAKNLMTKALNAGIQAQDRGVLYLDSVIPSYHKENNALEILCPTGIVELDNLIEGYKRRQLVCFLGGFKGKKTWSLIHLGREALINGLNVVHLTHEVSSEEIEQRYDMMFTSMTSRAEASDVLFKEYDKQGNEVAREYILRDTVRNLEAVTAARKKLKGKLGKLVIKKYAQNTCSIAETERFLDWLELYEGIRCDVLITDYIDIMKLPSPTSPTRDRLSEAYTEHKRIADERNILVATVSQSNRQGYRKKKMALTDLAEDIRKAAHVDLLIGLLQTDEEAENALMRIWVLANRSGPMDCGCAISQNMAVGQFVIDSWPIRHSDVFESTETDELLFEDK